MNRALVAATTFAAGFMACGASVGLAGNFLGEPMNGPMSVGGAVCVLGLIGAIAIAAWMQFRAGSASGQQASCPHRLLTLRARRARKLHDDLLQDTQGLFLEIAVSVDQLPEDLEVRQTLLRILDLSDDLIADSRERAKTLRTSPQAPAYLHAVLDEEGRQAASTARISFKSSATGVASRLGPDFVDETLALGSEALAQAFSRPGVGRVALDIRYEADHLRLLIADDAPVRSDSGCAIQDESRLHSLHQATRLAGARFIFLRDTNGTLVRIEIPGALVYA